MKNSVTKVDIIVALPPSHASFHGWHLIDQPFVMFDLVSCAEFEAADLIVHLNAFEIIGGHYAITDRDTGDTVERGSLITPARESA